MFKALYWYLRSSLERGPKSKWIFLNRVSYFRDFSLKQGQGFTVSAAHPHSITYRVPPPPPPGNQPTPPHPQPSQPIKNDWSLDRCSLYTSLVNVISKSLKRGLRCCVRFSIRTGTYVRKLGWWTLHLCCSYHQTIPLSFIILQMSLQNKNKVQ